MSINDNDNQNKINLLYTIFNYIFTHNYLDLIDYKYVLSLLYELIYIKNLDLIEDLKIIFKDFNVDHINFNSNETDHLDVEALNTYLYIFSRINKDINQNNYITEETKNKILIILDRLILKPGFF